MIIFGFLSACLLGGGIMFFGGLFNAQWDIMLIGLVLLGIGFLILYLFRRQEKKDKKKAEEERLRSIKREKKEKRKKMLETLISNQCFDLDTPINIERSKAIVGSYLGEVSEEELQQICQKAKERYDFNLRVERQKKQEEEEAKLSEIRQQEKEYYEQTTRYASLYGREKRKQYYLNSAKRMFDQAIASARISNFADSAYKNANQLAGGTNADWAIAGGIANALGGPAAGVMAAGEIQARNAAAAPKAQEIKTNAVSAKVEADVRKEKYEKEANQLNAIAESMNAKLVEDKTPDELFEQIQPKVQDFSVTETGAVKATVKTKAAKVKIFDSVDAFIDGTIKAQVINNGKEVGEILFVLPHNGSSNNAVIEGICISLNDAKANYELRLEPNKLWAIEI